MHLSLQWSGMTQIDKHLYTSRFALRWMMASDWTSSSSHCDSPTGQSRHNWTHLPPEARPPQQQVRTWWRRGCGGGSAARCYPPPSGGHPGTGGVWWTSPTQGKHSGKQCHNHAVEPPTRHPTCLVNKPDTGKAFWKTQSQSCSGTRNKTPNLFGEQARHRESFLENTVTIMRQNPQQDTQPVWWTSQTQGKLSGKHCHSHMAEPPMRDPTSCLELFSETPSFTLPACKWRCSEVPVQLTGR